MVGQIVPQQPGSSEDRQSRYSAGEDFWHDGECREGSAEITAVALQNIKDGLDADEEPIPAAPLEFGASPQNQYRNQTG